MQNSGVVLQIVDGLRQYLNGFLEYINIRLLKESRYKIKDTVNTEHHINCNAAKMRVPCRDIFTPQCSPETGSSEIHT